MVRGKGPKEKVLGPIPSGGSGKPLGTIKIKTGLWEQLLP
jgi:hypothetical protein